jgi:hypothetical protein
MGANKRVSEQISKAFSRGKRVSECLKELGCLDGEAYEALMRTYISAGRTNPSVAQRVEDDGIYVEPEMAKLIKIVCGS